MMPALLRLAAVMLAVLAISTAHAQPESDAQSIRDMLDRGEYAGAIARATKALTTHPERGDVSNLLGEALFATGELDAAREAFENASPQPPESEMQTIVGLGLLARYQGDDETAKAYFKRAVARYNLDPNMSSNELAAAAAAAQALGDSDPTHYRDAVRVYGEAVAADPDNLAARVALGDLLLAKYNNSEALETYREAIEIEKEYAPALLGLARSQHFDHEGQAMLTVLASLEINPNFVPARTFLAQLLIESEQYDQAEEQAERALAVNANALEALAVLASIHHLRGEQEKFDQTVARALAINPRYADLYNTLAELSVKNRLYDDAVAFAQKAVDMDPQSWRGLAILGINQLRIGEMQAGYENVARAFEGDPFNVWTKNTLDFLDSSGDYASIESEHATVVIHNDEARLLEPYATKLSDAAYSYYSQRYGWKPDYRMRVELYPDHRDFSVRTVGLAGIGILGVSFGPVVALDSPAARRVGDFNWGSVLWHEIAHSFHMGVSKHRVPRWFSEGLAVYEEQLAGNGWGNDVTPEFLIAFRDNKLLPVSALNNGFVRPTYPEQIGYSYYQASLVFAFIDERWGFPAILKMLEGYGQGQTTEELVNAVLGIDMQQLDADFDAYFRHRFERALAALPREVFNDVPMKQMYFMLADQFPSNYVLQMRAAAVAWAAKDAARAERFLTRAQDVFPEYAGGQSSYWLLAELFTQGGDVDKAIEQLERMVAINADHYEAHVKLADLLEQRGRRAEAAEILARAVYIYPYDPGLHARLAALYEATDDWQMAARARASVLALAPVDMAEAHYRLAHAYAKAGDKRAARYQILRALELAPNYYEALELLLELHDKSSNT